MTPWIFKKNTGKISKIAQGHSFAMSGVTLIETLVVVSILAGLIAGVGATFIVTMKSYVGEYQSEAIELEAQRAAMEMEYFISHSQRMLIMNGSTPSINGDRILLYQPANAFGGNPLAFSFTPREAVPGGWKGSLSITKEDYTTYTYSTNIMYFTNANRPNFFWVSVEGSIGYSYAIDTPSGRMYMGGSTLPGS
jgi:hypothetical protein